MGDRTPPCGIPVLNWRCVDVLGLVNIYNSIAQSVARWTSTWKGVGLSNTPGKNVSKNLNVTIRAI